MRVYGGPGGPWPPSSNIIATPIGVAIIDHMQAMSTGRGTGILKYFSSPSPSSPSHPSHPSVVTHCLMSDDGYPEVFSPSESEKSSGDCHESDSEPEPPQTSSSSSGSSSKSCTDPCDPSLPLPINRQARDSDTARPTSTKAGEISINSTQWKT